ncbi:MAG TPA: EamA family transporter, partial [Gammaproteobacteria bacterium]|nr:EamA family transporter [Gammaproteobacteria bacterium]
PARQGALSLFFGIAILASALRAGYGVTTRAGILHHADPQTMLLVIAPSWIFGGLAYAWLRERRVRLTAKKSLYSAISGVLVFLIAGFLMLAVAYGEATVVIPIANLSFIIALAIAVAWGMERLTGKKVLAVVCAAVSIVLLSRV